MKPTDIALLALPSDPRFSPDGAVVAFVVIRPDVTENVYRSAVWTVPADGSAPAAPLTAGEARDGRPRWSPDGRSLAFCSHRGEKGSQLLVLPMGGGEPRTVATSPEEIDDLAWSPDGRWLAFTARHRDEAQYGPEKDADRPPRRITRMGWRYDGAGWLADRPRALWLVEADGTAIAGRLVGGAGEIDVVGTFSWSPDSTQIAFCQPRDERADLDRTIDAWTISIDEAAREAAGPQQLTESGLAYDSPAWSRDGSTIALYRSRPMVAASNARIIRIDVASGAATEVDAASALDRGRSLLGTPRLLWDGDAVVHLVEDRGATVVYRDGVVLVGGDLVVTGIDLRPDRIALTTSTATQPGRVVVVDRATGAADARAGREVASFAARFAVQEPERFEVESADGTIVDAWLVRPAGAPAPGDSDDAADGAGSARLPVLLNVHGGPYTQYGHGFFDEFQVQAAAGYAVLYSNPRGSSGYGEAWGQAIRGAKCTENPGTGWGSVDTEDVTAVVDTALARWSFLDPDRVGVLGGSYGGYLTSWLVGHTDRFRAACSERAVNNVLSMRHTSDIGWWFNVSYVGTDEPDDLLACSPVVHADAISTPLLIMHSEQDYRCAIEQAEDLFLRLRQRGHDVEMVRFPGEGHELSRSGSPTHRVTRFEILLEFFDRHLKPKPTVSVGGSPLPPPPPPPPPPASAP